MLKTPVEIFSVSVIPLNQRCHAANPAAVTGAIITDLLWRPSLLFPDTPPHHRHTLNTLLQTMSRKRKHLSRRREVVRVKMVFLVSGRGLEMMRLALPPVSSHVWTVTICGHAWVDSHSHQPVPRHTTPLLQPHWKKKKTRTQTVRKSSRKLFKGFQKI